MFKVDEFDWDWTRRKVIVTMPYYGNRLKQTIYALKNITTSIGENEWGVLVGDDGCDHDISELENIKNVKVIKVRNYKASERNGCLCRNVLIKRCLSEWVISTDPEIHWSGDFFRAIINTKRKIVRPRNTRNISINTVDDVLDEKINIEEVEYKKFYDSGPYDPVNENSIQTYADSVASMRKWGVHYGLAMPTEAFVALRGYNEKMIHYGPDDNDMMKRALTMMARSPFWLKNGIPIKKKKLHDDISKTRGIIDGFHFADNVYATHLYHERLTGKYEKYQGERNLHGFIRNEDIDWGMSYDK